MQIKCSCVKNIIECNPKGDCWCKKLPYKIKATELKKNINQCFCKECLKKNLKKNTTLNSYFFLFI